MAFGAWWKTYAVRCEELLTLINIDLTLPEALLVALLRGPRCLVRVLCGFWLGDGVVGGSECCRGLLSER